MRKEALSGNVRDLLVLKPPDTTYVLSLFRKRYLVSEYTPIDSSIAFPISVSDTGRPLVLE